MSASIYKLSITDALVSQVRRYVEGVALVNEEWAAPTLTEAQAAGLAAAGFAYT